MHLGSLSLHSSVHSAYILVGFPSHMVIPHHSCKQYVSVNSCDGAMSLLIG